MSNTDELRQKIHKIQHQLAHPEQYGFPPDPDKATEAIMAALEAHIATVEAEAAWNIDHVLSVMEMGKELSKRFEKYDGDMDWAEYVQDTLNKSGLAALQKGKGTQG